MWCTTLRPQNAKTELISSTLLSSFATKTLRVVSVAFRLKISSQLHQQNSGYIFEIFCLLQALAIVLTCLILKFLFFFFSELPVTLSGFYRTENNSTTSAR
jgi:hypothetical protein